MAPACYIEHAMRGPVVQSCLAPVDGRYLSSPSSTDQVVHSQCVATKLGYSTRLVCAFYAMHIENSSITVPKCRSDHIAVN